VLLAGSTDLRCRMVVLPAADTGVVRMWRIALFVALAGVLSCDAPPCPSKEGAPKDWCRQRSDAQATDSGAATTSDQSAVAESPSGTTTTPTVTAPGAGAAAAGPAQVDAGRASQSTPSNTTADAGTLTTAGGGSGGGGGNMAPPSAAAGSSAEPANAPPACGNGIPEAGESCDGDSCPTECASQDACSPVTLEGSAAECTAQCTMGSISECANGDGCCPDGCKYPDDEDCPKSCGDGVVDAPEVCEPTSTDRPCPTSCDDMDPCTTDMTSGRPEACNVVCSNMRVTAAIPGDQCCPAGANANSDSDCEPTCNNGVREEGETCDPRSGCPTSCDDNRECTADMLVGSASQCTAACMNMPITRASNGDGCCPDGANANSDSDCEPRCGNGVVEDGELCEGSSCPSSCPEDDDPCTTDGLTGSRASCDAACARTPVTRAMNGDGCCPNGVNPANDNDCQRCGDELWDMDNEACDLGAPSSLPGGRRWDKWSCDVDCERRYTYVPCTSDSACGGGICTGSKNGTSIGCMSRCSGPLSPVATCTDASTRGAGHCVGGTCWIDCTPNTSNSCPPGSTCTQSQTEDAGGNKPWLCIPG
jgi:hypothetical protein